MQTHLSRAAAGARADIQDSFTDDQLVNQATFKRLAGDISDMTMWRWRRAGLIPEPTNIRGRNYWRAGVVRDVLGKLIDGEAT